MVKINVKNVEYLIRVIFFGGFVGFLDNDLDSEIFVDDENLLKNRLIFDRVLVILVGVIVNIVFVFVIIFV